MSGLRAFIAAALCVTLVVLPAFASPSVAPLGTVITADKAQVGQGSASVGTTVYSGDRLSTDMQGSVQIRAGAARLLVLSASVVEVNDNAGSPSAKLLQGVATFSTGNAKAFTLFASGAAIRAESNDPTIGQVRRLTDKELIVTSKRGALTVTVDGETKVIAEGTSYHVYLDPDAAAQGPEGAGSGSQGPAGHGGGPLKAGRSRFLIVATAITAVATYIAVSEALESPNRP